jgi:hypothetical protein
MKAIRRLKHVLLITVLSLVLLTTCSSDDEDDDSVNDDTDVDDTQPDDDEGGDDSGDVTIEERPDALSCENIDASGFGDPLAWDTLECDGVLMHANEREIDFLWNQEGTYGGLLIKDQETLGSILNEGEAVYSCEVDFETQDVVVVWSESACQQDYIDICSVRHSENERTTIAFWNNYFSDEIPADSCTPYHFAVVTKSDDPMRFYLYYRLTDADGE